MAQPQGHSEVADSSLWTTTCCFNVGGCGNPAFRDERAPRGRESRLFTRVLADNRTWPPAILALLLPAVKLDSAAETADAENADISSLLEILGTVPDPRDPRGRQHALAFVLAVCVVATLAGAKNYAEIARRARDTPQQLLKKLGAKWNWFSLRYQWLSMSVIRNLLTGTDGNALDTITGRWLFRQARKNGHDEWEFALDGKVMRGGMD